MGRIFAAVLAFLVLSAASSSQARRVDIALVLAIDVSASVSDERYALQRQGYANALADPAVSEAIAAGPEQAIAITVVEWSGSSHQSQVIGWTVLTDAASARAFAETMAQSPRAFRDVTSISGAIDFSVGLLRDSEHEATRRVVDVSGDGSNNNGRPVVAARDEAVASGIVINGLPILTEEKDLDAYYRNNVIGGPGAFVIVARDLGAFSNAILTKLVTEIAVREAPERMVASAEE